MVGDLVKILAELGIGIKAKSKKQIIVPFCFNSLCLWLAADLKKALFIAIEKGLLNSIKVLIEHQTELLKVECKISFDWIYVYWDCY